ncbi:hypothetical protein PtA15_15A114 [Puccinia triticina]|uniref:Ribosome biogenesis protein SLX9 n=2 Tax=Puccinia triticina TaxID=208348 RepID=A0ABY7D551_9BASI|nr:uncharacterized protein PtA15_15A114 [Puccinia triticina]WAQ91723.1 hypothetical protein PtA15_15A114 [Puccinia triticina]
MRRLKKKAKEQAVVGDLRPVIAALDEVLTTTTTTAPSNPVEKILPARTLQEPSTAAAQPKPSSKKALSHKQKAKVLGEESIRLPAILSHPEFKSRTHHDPPLLLNPHSPPCNIRRMKISWG